MFPLGDDNSQRRSVPYVTYVAHRNQRARLPARAAERRRVHPAVGVHTAPLLPSIRRSRLRRCSAPCSCTASWLHLGGNMLYLWIFGDNVEDRIRARQIPDLLSIWPASRRRSRSSPPRPVRTFPTSGASGAIAGVLGAYILMFPAGAHQRAVRAPDRRHAGADRLGLLDRAAARQRRRHDRDDERRTSAASPTWRTSAALPRAS